MTTTLDHQSPARALTRLAAPHNLPRTAPPPPSWERNGDRRDRLHLALSQLFAQRGDLDGVSVVADVLSEDLLWSV